MSRINSFKDNDAFYFTVSYLIAVLLFFWKMENIEFLIYSGVITVVVIGVYIFHKRVGLSRGVLWNLSILGFLHLLGGLIPISNALSVGDDKSILYNLWIIPGYVRYDKAIHAYGFGTITWLCWQSLKHLFPTVKPLPSTLSICVLCGLGVGAINEIVEFFAVSLGIETNVGGYTDTGWDLIANVIGSLLAVLIILYYPRHKVPVVHDR